MVLYLSVLRDGMEAVPYNGRSSVGVTCHGHPNRLEAKPSRTEGAQTSLYQGVFTAPVLIDLNQHPAEFDGVLVL